MADNTYSGETIIDGATLEAEDGAGLNTFSHLRFDGAATLFPADPAVTAIDLGSAGVLLTEGDFVRRTGFLPQNIEWSGSGGFAAGPAGLAVNLGELDAGLGQLLEWDADGFVPQDSALVFGSEFGEGRVTFLNDINLAGHTGWIAVFDSPISEVDDALMTGDIAGGSLIVGSDSSPDYEGKLFLGGENELDTLLVLSGTVSTQGQNGAGAGKLFLDASGVAVAGGRLELWANEGLDLLEVFAGASLLNAAPLTAAGVIVGGRLEVDAPLTVDAVLASDLLSTTLALGDAFLTPYQSRATSVLVDSTGTVELAADASFSGALLLEGLLDVDGGRTLTTLGLSGGDVLEDGAPVARIEIGAESALTVAQSGDTTYAGAIVGTGVLGKAGSGELTFTGEGSFEGGLEVMAGGFVLDGGTLWDDGEISVSAGARFEASTLDEKVGSITNAGTVNVGLALAADDVTNSGVLTVASASLADGEVASVEDAGLVADAVLNSGLLDVDADVEALTVVNTAAAEATEEQPAVTEGRIELAADIRTTGDVTNEGVLIVEGEGARRITSSAGGLAGTVAGAQIVIVDRLIVDQAGDTVYSGSISEGSPGALEKTGGGELTFTGEGTFEGGLEVTGGDFVLAGGALSDGGTISVSAGARFEASTLDEKVGSITNAGTVDVNLALVVDDVTNSGVLAVASSALADGETASAEDAGLIADTVLNSGLMELGADLEALTLLNTVAAGATETDPAVTEGRIEQASDIRTTGDVTNEGVLSVQGARRITSTSGGLAGAVAGAEIVIDERLVVEQGGDTTYGGRITDASSTEGAPQGAFEKSGAGELTFTGEGTFEGGLDLTAGDFVLDGGTLSDDGAISVSVGARFEASTLDEKVGSITNAGTVDVRLALVAEDVTNSGVLTVASTSLVDGEVASVEDAGLVAGAVLNSGLLDVDADVEALTVVNTAAVEATEEQPAVTEGQIELAADIRTTGDVTNEGLLIVEGARRVSSTAGGLSGMVSGAEIVVGERLVVAQGGDSTYAGRITDGSMMEGAPQGAFEKIGGGELTFTGEGTFEGGLEVMAGDFVLNGGTLWDDGAISVSAGARFEASTLDEKVGSITNAGTVNVGLALVADDVTNSGVLTVGSASLVDGETASSEDAGLIADAVVNSGLMDVDADVEASVLTNAGGIDLAADLRVATDLVNDGLLASTGTRRVVAQRFSSDLADSGLIVDGRLTVAQSGSSVFAGTIAGSGVLAKDGAGTLTLTGNGTQEGGLDVVAGTLVLEGGTVADEAAVVIAEGATFVNRSEAESVGRIDSAGTALIEASLRAGVIANTGDFTSSAVISAGQVVNSGRMLLEADLRVDGTLANNGAVVTSGERILQLGALAGTATNASIEVGGTLVLDTSDDGRYVGALFGGPVVKTGAGTLTLAGRAETVDLDVLQVLEGTLALDGAFILVSTLDVAVSEIATLDLVTGDQQISTLAGRGTISLRDNDLLVTEGGDFSGTVTGAGRFDLRNGTLRFSQDVTAQDGSFANAAGTGVEVAAGTTTQFDSVVVNGEMSVDGTLMGEVSVADGGVLRLGAASGGAAMVMTDGLVVSGAGSRLTGSGTVTGLATFQNAGELTPGDSPGLMLFEDLTLGIDSLSIFELAGSSSPGLDFDQAMVSGRLAMDATASLELRSLGGFQLAAGEAATLFAFSPGASSGQFGSVTSEFEEDVILALSTGQVVGLGASSDLSGLVATTANMRAVLDDVRVGTEGGVEQFRGGNLPALLAGSLAGTADPRAVFERASPEVYAGLGDFAYFSARQSFADFQQMPRIEVSEGEFQHRVTVSVDIAEFETDSSHDNADYQLSTSKRVLTWSFAWDQLQFGAFYGDNNGDVDGELMRADMDGSVGGLSASFFYEGALEGLSAHAGYGFATLSGDGHRFTNSGIARFDDVDTKASLATLGVAYERAFGSNWLRGGVAWERASQDVDGFTERGDFDSGPLELLAVERQKDNHSRFVLDVEYGRRVSQDFDVRAAFRMDLDTVDMKRPVVAGVVGESVPFAVEAPGFDGARFEVAAGARYRFADRAELDLESYYLGGAGRKGSAGGSLRLSWLL